MNDAFDSASDIASATSSCDVSLCLLVKGRTSQFLRLSSLHALVRTCVMNILPSRKKREEKVVVRL